MRIFKIFRPNQSQSTQSQKKGELMGPPFGEDERRAKKVINDAVDEFAQSIAQGLLQVRERALKCLRILDGEQRCGEAARGLTEIIDYIDELVYVLMDNGRGTR